VHIRLPTRFRNRASHGQSLVEFALVLPLLLLLVLIALDFGRVYLGYINVQNMARIAANDAANNPTAAWGDATDPAVVAYRNRILNDARAINCALPQVSGQAVVPPPAFVDVGGNGTATDVGDTASVSITCTFRVITRSSPRSSVPAGTSR
jgi:Flp pilus assembly protein TadG